MFNFDGPWTRAPRRRSRLALTAAFAATSLVLAACGSDEESADTTAVAETTAVSDSTQTTDPPATDAPETTVEAATTVPEPAGPASGEPIVVGFVTMDNGPLAQPAIGAAARAAVQYANEYLGGIGGRPLQFDECLTDFSPESSAACGNQFVANGASLVFMGIDLGSAAMFPILDEAGIPVIGQAPLAAADYTSSGRWFSGAQVAYAYGAATFFGEQTDVKKVVVFSYNLPGSISNRDTFMVPSLEAAGLEVEVVGIDYGAPDYTPFVAAAMATSPDLLYGFVQEADCTKLIVAADQLGYEGDIFAGNCGTFVAEVPDLADGVYTAGDMYAPSDLSQATEQAQADVQMYLDGMAEFAPDVAQSTFTQFAFAGVMNLRALLETVGADSITAESVVAEMEATTATPSFMADTYGCSLKVVPDYPNICSANVLMFQGKDGALAQVSDWIFGPDVFAS